MGSKVQPRLAVWICPWVWHHRLWCWPHSYAPRLSWEEKARSVDRYWHSWSFRPMLVGENEVKTKEEGHEEKSDSIVQILFDQAVPSSCLTKLKIHTQGDLLKYTSRREMVWLPLRLWHLRATCTWLPQCRSFQYLSDMQTMSHFVTRLTTGLTTQWPLQ